MRFFFLFFYLYILNTSVIPNSVRCKCSECSGDVQKFSLGMFDSSVGFIHSKLACDGHKWSLQFFWMWPWSTKMFESCVWFIYSGLLSVAQFFFFLINVLNAPVMNKKAGSLCSYFKNNRFGLCLFLSICITFCCNAYTHWERVRSLQYQSKAQPEEHKVWNANTEYALCE